MDSKFKAVLGYKSNILFQNIYILKIGQHLELICKTLVKSPINDL